MKAFALVITMVFSMNSTATEDTSTFSGKYNCYLYKNLSTGKYGERRLVADLVQWTAVDLGAKTSYLLQEKIDQELLVLLGKLEDENTVLLSIGSNRSKEEGVSIYFEADTDFRYMDLKKDILVECKTVKRLAN